MDIPDEVPQSLKWGARAGYAGRGAVYLIIGVLAVLAAAGPGTAEGTSGALKKLLDQPLGSVLLAVVGVGLLAFALWRFAQAVGDSDNHGSNAKGLVIRLFLFGSGVIHLALTAFVAGILLSLGANSDGGDPTSGWLEWLFGKSWGRWAALAVAVLPIGIGVAHIVKGLRAGYEKYLKVDDDLMPIVMPICSFGLIARGALFIIIGALSFYGGGIYDVESAPGLEEALSFVQDLPFGSALLLMVAVGVVAFALYSFIEAAYRRIGMPEAGLD